MVNVTPTWHSKKPWDRHGLILVVVGILYLVIGSLMLAQPASPTRSEVLSLAFQVMPYQGWCIGFIVVGVISFLSSSWPYSPKSLGYSCLSGWTVLWAGFNILGGTLNTNTAYVASGFGWVVAAFLWWAVSGLVSPPKERTSSGVAPAYSCDHSSPHSRAIRLLDSETGLEGESAGTSR